MKQHQATFTEKFAGQLKRIPDRHEAQRKAYAKLGLVPEKVKRRWE